MISIATATAQCRIDRVIPNLRYHFMISRVSVLFSAPAQIWSCGLTSPSHVIFKPSYGKIATTARGTVRATAKAAHSHLLLTIRYARISS